MKTKVDKMLYDGLYKFYLERAQKQAKTQVTPRIVYPDPPEALKRFEADFPGCSLGAFPWPDNPKVRYRTTFVDETYQRNLGKAIGRVLIATCGKDTLAQWSVCGACWTIICPTREVLDSPFPVQSPYLEES